jgi:hypothetical protein
MAEEASWQLVTTYGPLGLGWVFAALIAVKYVALVDKFVALLERNTQVMSELKTTISERLRP